MTVYHVTDGWTDLYGVFSTRELAQAWIERQKTARYPWWDGLKIEEWDVDTAEDLEHETRKAGIP